MNANHGKKIKLKLKLRFRIEINLKPNRNSNFKTVAALIDYSNTVHLLVVISTLAVLMV